MSGAYRPLLALEMTLMNYRGIPLLAESESNH